MTRPRTKKYSKQTIRLTDRQLKIAIDRIDRGDESGEIAKAFGVSREVLRKEIEEFNERDRSLLVVS